MMSNFKKVVKMRLKELIIYTSPNIPKSMRTFEFELNAMSVKVHMSKIYIIYACNCRIVYTCVRLRSF